MSENRVKLQQFHDLESEVNTGLNKVQDKAREPVHVVFGTSVKPAVNQVQVSEELAMCQSVTHATRMSHYVLSLLIYFALILGVASVSLR